MGKSLLSLGIFKNLVPFFNALGNRLPSEKQAVAEDLIYGIFLQIHSISGTVLIKRYSLA